MAETAYLVRYGVMGYVGRFRASPECDRGGPLPRGQAVVVRTDRGIELGEVLIPLDEAGAAKVTSDDRRVIRTAATEDLDRHRRAQSGRADRFATCLRVLEDEGWPWDLIDVEPLLEDGATVIQYLGPHDLDVAAIRARFRMTSDLDVVLEPVGEDMAEAEAEEPVGGGCGSGGCGSGGCGSGGCGSGGKSSAGHGCGSCALSRVAAARRSEPARTTA